MEYIDVILRRKPEGTIVFWGIIPYITDELSEKSISSDPRFLSICESIRSIIQSKREEDYVLALCEPPSSEITSICCLNSSKLLVKKLFLKLKEIEMTE